MSYYQDRNGRWHGSNGRFVSAVGRHKVSSISSLRSAENVLLEREKLYNLGILSCSSSCSLLLLLPATVVAVAGARPEEVPATILDPPAPHTGRRTLE